MGDWYVRGPGTSHQLVSLDSDSISPLLVRLSRLAAIALAVAGLGIMYWEHITRLRRVTRQEAKSRRLVRKLLERKRRGHTPLYDVQSQDRHDLVGQSATNVCFDCLYGRCNLRNHCPTPSFSSTVVTRSQMASRYAKSPVPSSSSRISFIQHSHKQPYLPTGKLFLSPERSWCLSPTSVCPDFPRGIPDGQDSSCQGDKWEKDQDRWEGETDEEILEESKAKTMKDVIRSAKEVRRLIRGNSVVSSSCDVVSITDDSIYREYDLDGDYTEADFNEESFRQTDSDFRHHLQLTAIDDSWSDTQSLTRRSVLSTSPQPVNFDFWDWEEEEMFLRKEKFWGENESEMKEEQQVEE